MNELLSMLVPLETLSGWPRVDDPTALYSLTLLFGIPLLIAVIVIALIEIGARRGDIVDASDPLWVGAQESTEVVPVSDSKGAEADAEAAAETSAAGVAAGTSASGTNVEGDDTGEHVGGAGARW